MNSTASGGAPEPQADPTETTLGSAQRRAGADRRRSVVDRRSGTSRRDGVITSQLDRRRGPGRRRTDYRRDAEEGHMNEEQLEFIKAVDEYKRVNSRPFPTWTEVLDVVLYLGYRKVAPIGEFRLCKGRQRPLDG
ncbi:MAG: hypothetical protein HRF50_07220 [Phycisphaerae bacterium]|jgi:hypothetical protein